MINIQKQINTWPYACFLLRKLKLKNILILKEDDTVFDPEVFGDATLSYADSPSCAPNSRFDLIISLISPEKKDKPGEYIRECGRLLVENGRLLFSMNNRLGIRFFCGDRDHYTGRVFDGIENYSHCINHSDGNCYTKSEMRLIIEKAGFSYSRFYAVFSGVDYPTHIIAEDFIPNEDLANRILPVYNYPPTVFMEEETLYNSLIKENLFYAHANGYLVEISYDERELSDISYATLSLGRSEETHSLPQFTAMIR